MKNNDDIPTTDTNEIKQLINRAKRGELDQGEDQPRCLTILFRQKRVIGEPVPDILPIDIQSISWEVFDGRFCSG